LWHVLCTVSHSLADRELFVSSLQGYIREKGEDKAQGLTNFSKSGDFFK
jgi:hypothetical protein